MNLDYNIYLELAAIPLDIILCIFLILDIRRRLILILHLRGLRSLL